MKIWIDISNSPHINLFNDLIHDLESEGHEIIITSRPLSNTISLLNNKKIPHTTIGKHYGKSIIKKIVGFPIRVFQLYQFLKNKKIHLAVSQSSFHSPVTAWILRIPSVYTNDNEHALGNIQAFIFAKTVLIPEILSKNKMINRVINMKKVIQYPGLKEGIYLWKVQVNKNGGKNKSDKKTIYIRPEPHSAQYYKGNINFLDDIIKQLQHEMNIVVLPRDSSQKEHYTHAEFYKIEVAESNKNVEIIANECDVFIGAGGSMTREMAILGIPTISVYQDDLLEVDRYLIENKRMKYDSNISVKKIRDFISSSEINNTNNELIKKGKKAYYILKNEILKFNAI